MRFFFETTKAPLIFNLFIVVTSRSSIRYNQGNELISWRGSHAWADLPMTDSLSHQYKTLPPFADRSSQAWEGVGVGSLLRIQDFSAPLWLSFTLSFLGDVHNPTFLHSGKESPFLCCTNKRQRLGEKGKVKEEYIRLLGGYWGHVWYPGLSELVALFSPYYSLTRTRVKTDHSYSRESNQQCSLPF